MIQRIPTTTRCTPSAAACFIIVAAGMAAGLAFVFLTR